MNLLRSNIETWLPVVEFEGLYEVSGLGRVRSLDRVTNGHPYQGKLLKLGTLSNSAGHKYVSLCRDGKVTKRLVHHLVLEAFVGPRPDGMEGLHYNDIAADNSVENLRWGTRSDNMHDLVRNRRHLPALRTHCVNGHEYAPENTLRSNKGARVCRTCIVQRSRNRRARNRAAA